MDAQKVQKAQDATSALTFWIKDLTGLDALLQEKVIFSLLTILILWLLSRIVKRLVWYNTEKVAVRYKWNKAISYSYVILLLLVLLRIWFRPSWSVMNVLALVAAALTLTLQDIIKSFAGWLYIIWRRPFSVGDRIQFDEIIGDVIDISAMKFSLNEIGAWVHADQSTGRVMHVPNSIILTKTITNYTEGFPYIWIELPVLVTFESDWKKGKETLRRIADRHSEKITANAAAKIKDASKKYMIFYHKLTPIVYTSLNESGIMLTIRILAEPRRRRDSEQQIWEDILTEFAEHDDLQFAYPTRRFYTAQPEKALPTPKKDPIKS